MKVKKISLKSANKTFRVKRATKKVSEPILLRKVNNVDKLFTKEDIKKIVDSIVGHNQI